jgi:hypothetical protein
MVSSYRAGAEHKGVATQRVDSALQERKPHSEGETYEIQEYQHFNP